MSTKNKNIVDENHKTEGLTKISDSMTGMVKKLLGNQGFVEIDLIKNWAKIVGDDLAKVSLPQKIDFKKEARGEGTLRLMVSTGAFALEIAHQEPLIVEKINTYFGYKAVEKIKIIQSGEADYILSEPKFADIEKKKLVTKEEQNYINAVTDGVQNEELKNKLASLAKSIMTFGEKEN